MDAARALRDVFADLTGGEDTTASDPSAVLAANGHPGLPAGLVAEAVGSYADTAPIEVAEHLAPYVMAHSAVPLPDAPEIDPGGWLDVVSGAPAAADFTGLPPVDEPDHDVTDPAFTDHAFTDRAFADRAFADHAVGDDHAFGDTDPADHLGDHLGDHGPVGPDLAGHQLAGPDPAAGLDDHGPAFRFGHGDTAFGQELDVHPWAADPPHPHSPGLDTEPDIDSHHSALPGPPDDEAEPHHFDLHPADPADDLGHDHGLDDPGHHPAG